MLETTLERRGHTTKNELGDDCQFHRMGGCILAENRDSAVLGRPALSGVTSHLRHSSAPSDGSFAASADRPLSAIGGMRQKLDTI